MILVKTKLCASSRHGIGLFADQFVPKGTTTWQYHPAFDRAFGDDLIEQMSEPARTQFMRYAYFDYDLNKCVLCFDDQRFINHCADSPNIISTPRRDVAARDIKPGEELLCDYRAFERGWFERHGFDPASFK